MKTRYFDMSIHPGEGCRIRFKNEDALTFIEGHDANGAPTTTEETTPGDYWRTPLLTPAQAHAAAIALYTLHSVDPTATLTLPGLVPDEWKAATLQITNLEDLAAALLTFYPGDLAETGLPGLLAKVGLA